MKARLKTNEKDFLYNLGNSYYSLGDFQRNIDYHGQDLSISEVKVVGDRAEHVEAYCNLGNDFRFLGAIVGFHMTSLKFKLQNYRSY